MTKQKRSMKSKLRIIVVLVVVFTIVFPANLFAYADDEPLLLEDGNTEDLNQEDQPDVDVEVSDDSEPQNTEAVPPSVDDGANDVVGETSITQQQIESILDEIELPEELTEQIDPALAGSLDGEHDSVLPDGSFEHVPDGMSVMSLQPFVGGTVVIALDPGHDNKHTGASANGLKEEQLNLQVAYACRDELQKKTNARIVMTRDSSGACPYPSSTSPGACNLQRVEAAKAQGAHFLISFHFNSVNNSPSARGMLMLVPSANYSNQGGRNLYSEGLNLSTRIRTELAALGIYDRGNYLRNSDDGSKYADGSVTDWYQMVREPKKRGMTGIVIEHLFLTNADDAAMIKQAGFTTKLGQADARGIINALGLSNQPIMSTSKNDFLGQISVSYNRPGDYATISSMRFAVTANGKTVNYNGVKQADGTYAATINTSDYSNFRGNYSINVVVNGNSIATETVNILNTSAAITTVHTTALQMQEKLLTVVTNPPPGLSRIRYAVWSEEKGQDDLIWYTANKAGDIWEATADITKHKTAGRYQVHVYATVNGIDLFVGTKTFSITANTATSLTFVKQSNGTYKITLNGVKSVSGVTKVQFPMWSKSDQSDMHWYTATKVNDTTYTATTSYANHKYNYGNFNVHAYVTGSNQVTNYVTGNVYKVDAPKINITTSRSADETCVGLSASNIELFGAGVSNVRFAVWSEEKGQDDLVWYTGAKSGAPWIAYVDIARHKTAGRYQVHIYADLNNTRNVFVGSTTFNISTNTATSLTFVKQSNGTYKITLNGVKSPTGVTKVQFPMWSKSDQSDMHWYTATRVNATTYTATTSYANHKYNYGNFNVHAYVTGANQVTNYVTGNVYKVDAPKINITTSRSADETCVGLSASNIEAFGSSVSNVRFAVWSEEKGQDDLVWYSGTKSGSPWIAYVDIARHKTAGKYQVHIYANINNTNNVFVGATTFNISANSASSLVGTMQADGTFRITLNGLKAPAGATKVQFPVWSKSDQSDLFWYTATRVNASTYTAVIDYKNHKYHWGNYNVHAYVTGTNQVTNFVKGTTFNVDPSKFNYDTSELYRIMGKSEVSVNQMVAYFNKNGKPYPSSVLATGGAADIRKFSEIILAEANAEGVRAEVVFAQIMHETGWLQFGGDVKINQFNFSGIGATGGGVPGNSFPSVQIGIRAQVQHLKAYASNEPLKQTNVDPRFSYVTRNSSIYVQWLGQKENPMGYGWAVSADYGHALMRMILQVKSH